MQHVFAIKIEGETLRVLTQRWDSAADMQRELPDGEYLIGSTFTVSAETRQSQVSQQEQADLEAKQRKQEQLANLMRQHEALAKQIADLG